MYFSYVFSYFSSLALNCQVPMKFNVFWISVCLEIHRMASEPLYNTIRPSVTKGISWWGSPLVICRVLGLAVFWTLQFWGFAQNQISHHSVFLAFFHSNFPNLNFDHNFQDSLSLEKKNVQVSWSRHLELSWKAEKAAQMFRSNSLKWGTDWALAGCLQLQDFWMRLWHRSFPSTRDGVLKAAATKNGEFCICQASLKLEVLSSAQLTAEHQVSVG